MSEPNIHYRVLRDEAEQAAVFNWWSRISGQGIGYDGETRLSPSGSGVRGVLRRAREPQDALLTEGFRHLWFGLPDRLRRDRWMPVWGCIAAVLADVREHDGGASFALAMAREVEPGAGKPRVSEMRFSQLQHSTDLTELHRRLRRTVQLLRRRVHIVSLADNVLHWSDERHGLVDPRPDRRLAVRWATDYFTELARYQKSANTQ